jgi:hypothetical protein
VIYSVQSIKRLRRISSGERRSRKSLEIEVITQSITDQSGTNMENLNKYLVSSGITFLASVVMVLLSQWDNITLSSFMDGSIVGIVFVAIRAGVKALFEDFLKHVAGK